ncbi:MAG: DUF402 domain-containing protein [Clostridium sp.]|jgi:predicted RNA-binding protein associated with RNAse of E/G family|nr:DUF402 domain-containing protein [Clostridium sp.]
MNELRIYRKRIIPEECIELKDDVIVKQNEDIILTKWKTLKPKSIFSHGSSCYFLHKGLKVSKFYQEDGTFLYWYCDIVEFSWEENRLTVTDLLADVIINPDGRYKVVDLEELADAHKQSLISDEQLQAALYHLNDLLTLIYKDKFDHYSTELTNLML